MIRVRPLLAWEKEQGLTVTRVRVGERPGSIVASDKQDKTFTFDDVLGPDTAQEEVFERSRIAELAAKVADGFHACVFAYGQTGSGKTYTIDGSGGTGPDLREAPTVGTARRGADEADPSNPGNGVLLRSVEALFRSVRAVRASSSDAINIKVSFLQIYNERIYDLLNPAHLRAMKDDTATAGLRLRWSPLQQFHVENLFVYECKGPEEVMRHFRYGSNNRAVASHKLNYASSRSHCVLSLVVERTGADNVVRYGRMSLVDLAGSERVARTEVQGQNLREAININQSLFVLRKVIAALASPSKDAERDHIPYRESKLTSLLKQSFGGNSYTVMLACLSPADSNFDDNLSTLQYATKARSIRNAPQVNVDPKSALIMRLQEEVANLRRRLRDAHTYIVKVTGSLPDFLRDGSKYTPEAAEKAMKAMAPVSAATNDAQQETTTVGKASPAPKGDVRLASGDLMASSDAAEGDGRVGRDDPKAKGRVQGTKDALPQVGELRDSRPAERDRRAVPRRAPRGERAGPRRRGRRKWAASIADGRDDRPDRKSAAADRGARARERGPPGEQRLPRGGSDF